MSEAPMTETERRFAFGENWRHFLRVLDEERIAQSQVSLRDLLETDLSGRSFLDVGSGSGLSSLAAMRLGASRVHSLDFDEGCVACTRELRQRYFPDDPRWTIERGDALDRDAMRRLGRFESSTRGACCTTRARCGRRSTSSPGSSPSAGASRSPSISIRDSSPASGCG